MNLFFLRHGIAVEATSANLARDAERPLTGKGERKLWQIAEAMEALELSFDLILSSPYLRARQTAQIVAEAFNLGKKLELSDTLTPSGSPQKLLELIGGLRPQPKDLLLVGHEPYLSELISLLLTGGHEARITLKKGGLAKLTTEHLQPGRCAELEWLLTPKQMCLLA